MQQRSSSEKDIHDLFAHSFTLFIIFSCCRVANAHEPGIFHMNCLSTFYHELHNFVDLSKPPTWQTVKIATTWQNKSADKLSPTAYLWTGYFNTLYIYCYRSSRSLIRIPFINVGVKTRKADMLTGWSHGASYSKNRTLYFTISKHLKWYKKELFTTAATAVTLHGFFANRSCFCLNCRKQRHYQHLHSRPVQYTWNSWLHVLFDLNYSN